MDQNSNTLIAENIEQTFRNFLAKIDRIEVLKVFDKLKEKDKNEEIGLDNIIENIIEEESGGNSDNMDIDNVSTKQDSQKTNSIEQTNSNSDAFYSSNENAPNSFNHSSEDKSKEIDEIANQILYLIKNNELDEKDIEDILSQVLNYFMTKSNENYKNVL